METEKNIYKHLLEVFITKPVKETGGFFKDIYLAIKSMVILLINPNKLLQNDDQNTENFHTSRTIFKFIFFALVVKIAFNEMSDNSSLTVIEQITYEVMFLGIYLIGLFYSVFIGFIWERINKNKEKHSEVNKLFISIFNVVILFQLVLYILGITLEAGVQFVIIIIIVLSVLFRVKKFFDNKALAHYISGFVGTLLLSFYFFIMSALFDAIWNMNTANVETSEFINSISNVMFWA